MCVFVCFDVYARDSVCLLMFSKIALNINEIVFLKKLTK